MKYPDSLLLTCQAYKYNRLLLLELRLTRTGSNNQHRLPDNKTKWLRVEGGAAFLDWSVSLHSCSRDKRGREGGQNGWVQSKRPPVFRPLWCWCWQTDGVATVPDECHRHLWLCGIGGWYLVLVYSVGGGGAQGSQTHTHRFRSVLLCFYRFASSRRMRPVRMCAFFIMWPLHVGILMRVCVCVCKSWPATGPWHSLSSCHSMSPAALWENSCRRRNKMSWFSKYLLLALIGQMQI